jgi:hypothetical protein
MSRSHGSTLGRLFLYINQESASLVSELLILTSPPGLISMFEVLNEPCSNPFEARYARLLRIYFDQYYIETFAFEAYLSEDCGKMNLRRIFRRFSEMSKAGAYILEDYIVSLFVYKIIQKGNEIIVTNSL